MNNNVSTSLKRLQAEHDALDAAYKAQENEALTKRVRMTELKQEIEKTQRLAYIGTYHQLETGGFYHVRALKNGQNVNDSNPVYITDYFHPEKKESPAVVAKLIFNDEDMLSAVKYNLEKSKEITEAAYRKNLIAFRKKVFGA